MRCWIALLLTLLCIHMADGAEVVTLNEENFDKAAAPGNEADAIYGDYSISNDRIVAVVANPELIGGRSASRSSPQQFDACVIDMTLRSGKNAGRDMLAWYAPGPRFGPHASDFQLGTANYNVDYARAFKPVVGKSASFSLHSVAWSYKQPPCIAKYTIEDGWRYLLCETIYINPADRPEGRALIVPREKAKDDAGKLQELADGPRDGMGVLPMPDESRAAPPAGPIDVSPGFSLSADGVIDRGVDSDQRLLWIHNKWFGQAYGVLDAPQWTLRKRDGSTVEMDSSKNAAKGATLHPGEQLTVARKLIVGRDLFEVREVANEILGVTMRRAKIVVSAPDGPVSNAFVTALFTRAPGDGNGKPEIYASGQTDENGVIEGSLPERAFSLRVEAVGRKDVSTSLDVKTTGDVNVKMDAAARVSLKITDENGGAIPCKVEFRGREGTPDPFFFPETGDRAVCNLRYTETGDLTQLVAPGKYDVIVTRGPEYDRLTFVIDASEVAETKVTGKLQRVIDTRGWISADFHAYSTLSNKPAGSPPSAASTRGRVLNMLAEQIEFVPATELNKVFTYEALVAELGAEKWLKSCAGIGLNDGGRKYAYNEQYSFPIVYKPRWQDGGAPQRPQHCGQIEWLRSFGAPIDINEPWATARRVGYEKLIILMQPDNNAPQVLVRRPPVSTSYNDRDVAAWWNDESALLRPMFRDTDNDGVPDHVHQNFAATMDALDVRTLAPLLKPNDKTARLENDVVDWMLMRQSGYRMPGVITSGATTNFHGSGGVRTYVRSAADDPSKIDPLDIVRAVRAGKATMTTGPFIEAKIENENGESADVGEVVTTAKGHVTLKVKVQCPNWIALHTVRVLINNKRDEKLEFTRQTQKEKFGDGHVQFEQAIPLTLSADAQIIVLALGSGPNLRVRKNAADQSMGHVALINPICVDVGGDGLTPQPPHLDKIEAELMLIRPLLSRQGSSPARVRLTITNHDSKPARGAIQVMLKPNDIVSIKGDGKFPYALDPEKKVTIDFDLELSAATQTEALIGGVPKAAVMLSIPRDGVPPGVAPARLQVILDDSPRATVPDGPL